MRFWLAIPLLLIWPVACRAQDPTFSDAVGMLGQERSYAEGGAALLKRYAPDDIEGRAGYAQAKAAFDGLIEQLLADLAQNQDPALSPAFRDRLDVAVGKRVAFSERVNDVLKDQIPPGGKPALLDALAKLPAQLIKELFAGGIAIWKEWESVGAERRNQIATRLEAQRWKPFSEITPAL